MFAKRGDMADKTPQQIIDEYFDDVKSVVDDADMQNRSRGIFRDFVDINEGSTPPDDSPAPPKPAPTPSNAKLTEEGVTAQGEIRSGIKGCCRR